MNSQNLNTEWHFPIMIIASLVMFFLIVRIVLGKQNLNNNIKTIIILALVVVVVGMLIGKYGSQIGLKWWIYYPIPMLMTVVLPPLVLKMDRRKTITYLFLSFFSAPFIHFCFSFLLGWNEYMPFWDIPYFKELF